MSVSDLGTLPSFFDSLAEQEAFITCMHIQQAAYEADQKMANLGIGEIRRSFPKAFQIRFGDVR